MYLTPVSRFIDYNSLYKTTSYGCIMSFHSFNR